MTLDLSISLDNTCWPGSPRMKFWGLITDADLLFAPHANELRKSCVKEICYVRSLSAGSVVQNKAAGLLFNVYVVSRLKYALIFETPFDKDDMKRPIQLTYFAFSVGFAGWESGLGCAFGNSGVVEQEANSKVRTTIVSCSFVSHERFEFA